MEFVAKITAIIIFITLRHDSLRQPVPNLYKVSVYSYSFIWTFSICFLLQSASIWIEITSFTLLCHVFQWQRNINCASDLGHPSVCHHNIQHDDNQNENNGTAHFKNVNNCLNTNIYSYLETYKYLMLFNVSKPELIRNLWQLKTAVSLHWCLICALPFA